MLKKPTMKRVTKIGNSFRERTYHSSLLNLYSALLSHLTEIKNAQRQINASQLATKSV